ncbi:Sulfite exporter TauE/SafE [Sporomusa ovata DSM 2662]|uniref:Probable membrane transporter protein n=2 Tax=Sporomusa ovata TaxID=2378 RepID=A0A0U1L1D3_9FIRM|nr:sulfite exporter TauE/SafE [Sporomusa ovata DSM 2662]CQR73139.1 hypothetical protein SpAn4DRAFT_2371 [Sporomusa ovata]
MFTMLSIITGMITGILSGLLGIGGGAILVAIAISILNVSQHIAQGAALAAIVPTAIVGVIKHHQNGLVNYKVGIYLIIGGCFGSFFGAHGANMLDEAMLRQVFSMFFGIIGIQLLVSSLK